MALGGFLEIQEELERMLGRDVDVAELPTVYEAENRYRSRHVLKRMKMLYAACC